MFFGSAAVIVGRDYTLGTAVRMGPAYFPSALGVLLVVIGLIGVIRSFIIKGEPVEAFAIKPFLLILFSIFFFGWMVRGAGLAPSAFLLILVSGFSSIYFRWKPALLLATGLTLFSILIFVKALGLPIPVFGPWFDLLSGSF